MEISAFVRYRPSWRGIVLVLVLVVAASAIAGYLVYRQPPNYKARATVFVGQILPSDVPDYLLRPVADNYQATLDLPRVILAAARASGESEAAVAGGLSSERISSTANVDVLYQSPRFEAIKDVLRVASRAGLITVAQMNLARSRRAVTSAQKDYARATQALAKYEAANGNDGSARHAELAANVERTLAALGTSAGGLDDAQLELGEATTASVIFVRDPEKESRIPDAARTAVTAGLIAAMVGAILLLVVDSRRRSGVRWNAASDRSDGAIHWTAPPDPSAAGLHASRL